MRRVLIAAWGAEASAYVGKRITLYGDPSIKFGKDAVGGIRISHLSGLDKPLTVALTVTRGKRAPFTVQPLTEPEKPADKIPGAVAAIAKAATVDNLDAIEEYAKQLGITDVPAVREALDVRRTELSA